MSKAELKREMAALPLEDQNELAAYLLHLRLERDPVWRTESPTQKDGFAAGTPAGKQRSCVRE